MKSPLIVLLVAACSSAPSTNPTPMVNGDGLDGGVIDGTVPIDGGVATLSSTDSVLSFGTVLANTASAVDLKASISNQGDPSHISGVVVSGSGAGAFLIVAEDCFGTTLGGTSSCTVKVRFVPTVIGVADATLTVTGSGGGVTTIALKGTGVPAGALAFTPVDGAFGNVIATKTADLSLTLENVGTTLSGAITANLSGPDAASFLVVASNCAGGLAPSTSCSLTVRFSPNGASGARSATLSASDAQGGTMTAALSGTGI